MSMMCSPPRCEFRCDPPLLLISLDNRWRANLGLIRILAQLAPRVTLPQQIPTLIEFDLDGFQSYLIVVGQFRLAVEMLLLVNKTFDLLQDGVIGRRFSHVTHLFRCVKPQRVQPSCPRRTVVGS